MFTCQHESLQVNIMPEYLYTMGLISICSAKGQVVVKRLFVWYTLSITKAGEIYGNDYQDPGR